MSGSNHNTFCPVVFRWTKCQARANGGHQEPQSKALLKNTQLQPEHRQLSNIKLAKPSKYHTDHVQCLCKKIGRV